MATLGENISASATEFAVTGGTAATQGEWYTIDDEVIEFIGFRQTNVTQPRWSEDTGYWRVTRGVNRTTAASHSSGATITAYSGAAGGGGEGAGVLEDPGEIYEPNIVVAEGYRIAEEIEGELRVFEAVQAGTTNIDATVMADFDVNLSPLGVTDGGGSYVDWRYLGIVGELPWDVMPITAGLPDNWTVDPEYNNVEIVSPADVTDYEYMLVLKAKDGVADVPLLELTTSGDADWYFRDSGTGIRFKDTDNGNSIVVNISMDAFYVHSQASGNLFNIDRGSGAILMPGLRTSNPNVAGELWNDGGTLKVSAG